MRNTTYLPMGNIRHIRIYNIVDTYIVHNDNNNDSSNKNASARTKDVDMWKSADNISNRKCISIVMQSLQITFVHHSLHTGNAYETKNVHLRAGFGTNFANEMQSLLGGNGDLFFSLINRGHFTKPSHLTFSVKKYSQACDGWVNAFGLTF